jgi:exopolyphosphatase/guanosine-5'-triphosphate,3'-diphosphate pyrophosphatase
MGHKRSVARADAYPDVRRRSIVALAERCRYHEAHARQVAALALGLFDATASRHGLQAPERSLLEFAALLHDIGRHISYPDRHRHTEYLIRNGSLRGFDPRDVEIMALVGRFHRRGVPRKKNVAFAALSRPDRQAVRVMAGLLRLADALDRSHRGVVKAVAVAESSRGLRLRCDVEGDAGLEQWASGRRVDLLERALGQPLRVEFAPVAAAAAVRARAAGA